MGLASTATKPVRDSLSLGSCYWARLLSLSGDTGSRSTEPRLQGAESWLWNPEAKFQSVPQIFEGGPIFLGGKADLDLFTEWQDAKKRHLL